MKDSLEGEIVKFTFELKYTWKKQIDVVGSRPEMENLGLLGKFTII